jgi:hypothetical protein
MREDLMGSRGEQRGRETDRVEDKQQLAWSVSCD